MDNDQKRILTAFLLIIIVLLIWSLIATPRVEKTSDKVKVKLPDSTKIQSVRTEAKSITGDTIAIEQNFLRMVFLTNGGGIKSLYLKKYNADIVPEKSPLFLTKISDTIINFEYFIDSDSLVFFKYINNKRFTKVYYFDEDYGFTLRVNYPDTIHHLLSLRSGLKSTEKKNEADDLRHFNVYVKSEKLINISKNITDSLIYKNNWQWSALRTKYFILILNNISKLNHAAFYRLSKLNEFSNIKVSYFGCAMSGNTNRYGLDIFADSSFTISVLLLPAKYSELAQYNEGYEQIISGSIWAPIERVIIFILNLFYSIVKNYGFAIIIFSLLFKIIFFPLSRQMIVSQQQMQLLQPELKKIQDKYKNDPQALNREMMHLYKVYKVNPFSGCLPLLIQFPIFIALYQVLSTAIEFRCAPFILWITDLSLKDPYYILPVAMGVLMLIQSLMTTIDPRQRFMIIMMPLIMIFVFLNFPSGLQLYWFTYNILSILENLMIKKKVFR
ncbi:MAG: membrane protein insertase YidC [candidate division WOR-3 bacterium]